jgi:hypothetical protein
MRHNASQIGRGKFVLSVSEVSVNGVHSSFFDLFRLANGKVVEHWDTTEAVPQSPNRRTVTVNFKAELPKEVLLCSLRLSALLPPGA